MKVLFDKNVEVLFERKNVEVLFETKNVEEVKTKIEAVGEDEKPAVDDTNEELLLPHWKLNLRRKLLQPHWKLKLWRKHLHLHLKSVDKELEAAKNDDQAKEVDVPGEGEAAKDDDCDDVVEEQAEDTSPEIKLRLCLKILSQSLFLRCESLCRHPLNPRTIPRM